MPADLTRRLASKTSLSLHWQSDSLSSEKSRAPRDQPRSRLHQLAPNVQLPLHRLLARRSTMRASIDPMATRLSERRDIAPTGFHASAAMPIHRAVFGSATMISWPNVSRCCATHSLAVEASIKIRACGRPQKSAVRRSRVLRMLIAASRCSELWWDLVYDCSARAWHLRMIRSAGPSRIPRRRRDPPARRPSPAACPCIGVGSS